MGDQRVFAVSYEGLMELQDAYLHNLYKDLGIDSTYTPTFNDGNEKYITDARHVLESQQRQRNRGHDMRPPKPQSYHPLPPRATLLPKRLITVVGSTFVSTAIAVAVGAFPSEGRWIQDVTGKPQELTFEDTVTKTATSAEGDWQIQHINLPEGRKCDGSLSTYVEALVPEECARSESSITTAPVNEKILVKSRIFNITISKLHYCQLQK